MTRTKGILAAGTFTGLVLITILALGFGPLNRSQAQSSGDTAAAPAGEPALLNSNGLNSEEAVRAWQDYSTQLEETVRTLQERDSAYQQQLDAANQTILQLQDQINNDPAPSFFGNHEAREEHEEHEDHEHDEHEAFEFEGFDD